MPASEGPADQLRRASADPASLLYGIDGATRIRLLRVAELRGDLRLDADALLEQWAAFATRVTDGDVRLVDLYAALSVRDDLAQIDLLLHPGDGGLREAVVPADVHFWDSTASAGRAIGPNADLWVTPRWWHARVPRTLVGEVPAPPPCLDVEAYPLPRILGKVGEVSGFTAGGLLRTLTHRGGGLEAARDELRKRAFYREIPPPSEQTVFEAFVALRDLVANAPLLGADVVVTGADRPLAPTMFVTRKAYRRPGTAGPPASLSAMDGDPTERAREASLRAIDHLIAGGTLVALDRDAGRRDGMLVSTSHFAELVDAQQRAREDLRLDASTAGSVMHGLSVSAQALLIPYVAAHRGRRADEVIEHWGDMVEWSGIEISTSSLELGEYELAPAKRDAVAGFRLALPPAHSWPTPTIDGFDRRWIERTIGVVDTIDPEGVDAAWWWRRAPTYLNRVLLSSLASRAPAVHRELEARNLTTDPRHVPSVQPWKVALGMADRPVSPRGRLPLPLPLVLQFVRWGGDARKVREELAHWVAGSRYAPPTDASVRVALIAITELVHQADPTPAGLSRLLAPVDERRKPRRGKPAAWSGRTDGLPLARAASLAALLPRVSGDWTHPAGGHALDLACLLAEEHDWSTGFERAAADETSALFGLPPHDQALLVEHLAAGRLRRPLRDAPLGGYDLWQAGRSWVDVRLACWERFVGWADPSGDLPPLGSDEPFKLLEARQTLHAIAGALPPAHAPFHDRLKALDARYWAVSDAVSMPVDRPTGNSERGRASWWWYRVPHLLPEADRHRWTASR